MDNILLIAITITALIIICLVIVLVMWLISKSKGKIDIVLDNYNYSPGDTINGKIKLTINKPIHSKELKIKLIGEKIQKSYTSVGTSTRSSTDTQVIFDFSEPVAGVKDYEPGDNLSYDFKIKIPQNLIKSPQLTGVLGVIQNLAMMNTMVKWFLVADLSIPGIDLRKKVQINIG